MFKDSGKASKDGFLQDLDLLSEPGIIGCFDHFEVIEVVRYDDGKNVPTNVLTLAVAVEGKSPEIPRRLNLERIRVKALQSVNFGIFRSVLPVSTLKAALCEYLSSGLWKPNGIEVQVGDLLPVCRCIVPANSTEQPPLNRVLKNNFFAGSYVLELFDVDKVQHDAVMGDPETLKALAAKIIEHIPLNIDALSDRVGNLVVQFPIEAIRSSFYLEDGFHCAEIAWNPAIPERELIVTTEVYHDQVILALAQGSIRSGCIKLSPDPDYGTLRGYVWDTAHQLVLSATSETAFSKSIRLNMGIITGDPRVFPEKICGSSKQVRVSVKSHSRSSMGQQTDKLPSEPIRKRVYAEEQRKLAQQRKFIQYAVGQGSKKSERERALSDVRSLISEHGEHEVWLWDPYLDPQDILDTLFYNTARNAPMRALTALKRRDREEDERPKFRSSRENKVLWVLRSKQKAPERPAVERYREALSGLHSNFLGLNVEFRSSHGQRGWPFHDRFLIFPPSKDDAAKVWSLGTSINSLGKQHHILQQADNPQLIADAFQSLWDELDHPENLIWKR